MDKRKFFIMIGFIIGLFVGAFLGVLLMCICNAASRSDDQIEKMEINRKKGSKDK